MYDSYILGSLEYPKQLLKKMNENIYKHHKQLEYTGSLPNKPNNFRHGIPIVKGENPQIRLKFTEPIVSC